MQFRVETVISRVGGAYVLALQLGVGEFSLPEQPRLGGVPVVRSLSKPRALMPDGAPDTSIFAFHLVSPSDAAKLVSGQLVELA